MLLAPGTNILKLLFFIPDAPVNKLERFRLMIIFSLV
jgi:hypothetical protein